MCQLVQCQTLAASVAVVGVPPLEIGLRDSGSAPLVGDFEEGGRRKRIRLTKKTDVRKRFGVDSWGQPIPKRWKAATLKGVTLLGCEEGHFVLQLDCLTWGEPKGVD